VAPGLPHPALQPRYRRQPRPRARPQDFKDGRAKIEIGLARGKKLHDKRATLRERESRREIDKATRASSKARW
jgi:hypothetical protein